jgi:RNA recognition motif-containing protein
MNTKVYVDNLAAAMTETVLIDLFSRYGNVVNANIPVNRENHQPRGVAFVTMVTPEGARSAIHGLNGKAVGSSTLAVSEAWPGEERTNSSGASRNPRRSTSHLF